MNFKIRKKILRWIKLTGSQEPLLELLVKDDFGLWLEKVLKAYLDRQDLKIPDLWHYFWFNHFMEQSFGEHEMLYLGMELSSRLEKRYLDILALLQEIIRSFSYPLCPIEQPDVPYLKDRIEFYQSLVRDDISTLQHRAYGYFFKAGSGLLADSYYFEFQGVLMGMKTYKASRLNGLGGYEAQKGMIVENTLRFLEGKSSNNVFLYGSRGTGKTSLIKALLEEYKHHGLRLIKIFRDDIEALPQLCELLKKRREKFIINLDDISYDEQEVIYKKHKVAIDSFFDREPHNVLLYATSNSQEIVKYYRQETTGNMIIDNRSDEERKLESPQRQVYDERRAFTERFGLTVFFGRVDNSQILDILRLYKEEYDLKTSLDELAATYQTWVGYHGSPNGRTIENFIRQYRGN